MNKSKFLKGACLAAVAGLLPVTQATAGEEGVSWSLSGWINEAVIYYDDGNASDIVQAADNGTTLGSRMTFAGSADLPAGLFAGFEVIIEPLSVDMPLLVANQDGTGSPNAFGDTNGQALNVLGSSVNFGGSWGKFTVGLQTMPTDNIAVLADPSLTLWDSIGVVFRANNFTVRGLGAGATNTTWGSFLQCQTIGGGGIGLDCNGIYRNGVRYDLPTFIENLGIAVGYANDDVYDVAGKWNGELGRLKTILHLGYTQNQGVNTLYKETDLFQAQLGLMDPVTGLFGTFAYQNEDSEGVGLAANDQDDSDVYWLKVGIKKQFNSLGDTAIAFQYGSYNDQYGAGSGLTGSEVERIGVSVNQYFGSKLIIYGAWENMDLDVDGPAAATAAYSGADDLDLFTLGLNYFF